MTDHFPTEPEGLPEARPTELLEPADGGTVDLHIAPVAKRIGPATVRLLGYRGSCPGPTLRVSQASTLTVNVANDGDLETTVHWHGLRLDNRYDGTAATQRPIPVGGRFSYRLEFPDPGVYWYHPHIREDYGQEMGLYGAIVVVPSEPDYWPPVHRELAITLDDILLHDGRVAPFSRAHSTHTAMGRFGNVMLVNGEVRPSIGALRGEVIRLYLVNTANTRVFNVALPGAVMKLVGGDSGHCEREELVDRVLLAPSERAVVDVLFGEPGTVTLEHRTPQRTYALGTIAVSEVAATPALAARFGDLRTNADLSAERGRLAGYLDADPDHTLALVAEMTMEEPGAAVGYGCPMHPEVRSDQPGRCPKCGMKLLAVEAKPLGYVCPMHPEVRSDRAEQCPRCGMKLVPATLLPEASGAGHDHGHGGHGGHHDEAARGDPGLPAGIEWEDDMVEVNRITTPANTRWKLIDRATGAEGAAIAWRFRVGDRVKLRLVNELDSDHPMHHPFHVHGAGRFLILSRAGVAERNLVWKDTVLIPTGQTVDLLLEVTNPGIWMAHCHIAEHHEGGMMLSFVVEPQSARQ